MTRLLLTLLLCLLPVQSWAAVAFGTIGTVNGGTTSLSVPLPASVADGDLLALCVMNKYPTNGPSTPSGYTAVTNGQASGGAGADGLDSGNMYATWFVKVASGESGDVAVTVTSGNSASGVLLRYTNATGSWSYAATNGADTSQDTSWSVTGAGDPGVTSGDMVVMCSGGNVDNVLTSLTGVVTQTGVTYGTVSERADGGFTSGDDHSYHLHDVAATAGTSSDVPTFTVTFSGNVAGATAFLRIREAAAASGVLQPASGYLGAIIK